MKLMTEELKRELPALYTQEGSPDAIVHGHFYIGQWHWYATEFDGEDIFFGFVVGHEPELGYFSLSELEQVQVEQKIIEADAVPDGERRTFKVPVRVERDAYWKPTLLSIIRKQHGA